MLCLRHVRHVRAHFIISLFCAPLCVCSCLCHSTCGIGGQLRGVSSLLLPCRLGNWTKALSLGREYPCLLARLSRSCALTFYCREAGSGWGWDKDPPSQRVGGCSLIRLLCLQDPQSTWVIMEDHISSISCKNHVNWISEYLGSWSKPQYFLPLWLFQSICSCFPKHTIFTFQALFTFLLSRFFKWQRECGVWDTDMQCSVIT